MTSYKTIPPNKKIIFITIITIATDFSIISFHQIQKISTHRFFNGKNGIFLY